MSKNRHRDRRFNESALKNNSTYVQYYNRLTELAISMFEWKNLPDTVDARFLELALFTDGKCVYFNDEVLGHLALKCATKGKHDVYRIPKERRAYASNGYYNDLNEKNSVIIYNNMLHTNSMLDVRMFAERLYNLDRAIDVNANAQKTPVLIQCSEQERLAMINLYKQWSGNEPVIFGESNLNVNGVKVLRTDAPFVCDKLFQLKTQIWNEALTYLGISNINVTKKERMITDEVTRNQGGTMASRYSRLTVRQEACKKINAMFGTSITCEYREDFQVIERDGSDESEGDDNE